MHLYDYILDTGDSVPVEVDTGGHFIAEFRGKRFEKATLDELLASLNRKAHEKRVRISVEVGTATGDNVVITGIHADGATILTREHGVPERRAGHSDAFKPWDLESVEKLRALRTSYDEAGRTLNQFIESRRLKVDGITHRATLKDVAKAAVDAAKKG